MSNFLSRKTKIFTSSGTKSISEVTAHDKVLGYKGSEAVLTNVSKTYKEDIKYVTLIKITTNQSKLLCTRDQEIFVEGKGWKKAERLTTGDYIRSIGDSDPIHMIKSDYSRKGLIDVYSLECGTGNYYANQLLVRGQ